MQIQAKELKVGSIIVVGQNKTATVHSIMTENGKIYAYCPEYNAPFTFNYDHKIETIYQPPDFKPESLPEHPIWTDALIKRLKKYIESSQYFIVFYREDKVYGLDPRNPEYGTEGWPAFYLSEFDDDRPYPNPLWECLPEDFKVVLLKPVNNWQDEDPNWSEADPELWKELNQ